jgi:pyruvate formate lyase activating enzyme
MVWPVAKVSFDRLLLPAGLVAQSCVRADCVKFCAYNVSMSFPLEQLPEKPLREVLRDMTAPADAALIKPEADGAVRCFACGHRCLVRPGKEGVCKVRWNDGGTLRVPFGYVACLACDPIEKKPFNHMLPGNDIVTFGMLGCDFHCGYCQNWVTSQALRDDEAGTNVEQVTPEQIVQIAMRYGAPAVASSYNEPLITSEWSAAVFKEARAAGLKCCYISNGNGTPEVLKFLRPLVEAYKVDLKGFNDRHYRELGGVLENVKSTIRMLKEMGFWVEIVTLLVPGFNDDPEELKQMAGFLAGIDTLMPWHITAFHSDYKMDSTPSTTTEGLLAAGLIARAAGMRYVYLGNMPGRVGEWEDTRCHNCGETLITRRGFNVLANRIPPNGNCPRCHTRIPGIWS